MFSEHFTGFISIRSKVWCSAELTIGFDPRYFVSLLHLPSQLRQNTASGSNVQGIVPRMIILWESLREKWFCWKTILVKPIIDRRDKVDVRANRCLHQWATKQSLYQMMSHTTASPKYTLALTKILISPEGSNDLPHSLYSFVRTTQIVLKI